MSAGPLATFLILLLIGVAAAILFDRYVGTSWFNRQVSSGQRRLITSSLVGIAGSFIGFHLFALLGIIIAGEAGLVPRRHHRCRRGALFLAPDALTAQRCGWPG